MATSHEWGRRRNVKGREGKWANEYLRSQAASRITVSSHVTVHRGACTGPVIARPVRTQPYPTPLPLPQSTQASSLHPIIHRRLPRIAVCLRNRRLPFLSRQMRKASEVAPPLSSVSIILSAAPAAGRTEMATTPLQTGTNDRMDATQRLGWRGGRRPQQLGSSSRRGRRHLRGLLQLRVQMQRGKANKMSQPPTRPRPHL